MRRILFYILLFVCTEGLAEEIRVSLFNTHHLEKVEFKARHSAHFANHKTISFPENHWKKIKVFNGGIYIEGTNFGKKVLISSDHWQSNFSLRSTGNQILESVYEGKLEISVKNGNLSLINIIELEDYLTGVVESESGKDQNLEYYKTQAIISRTWTLSNLEKHSQEGFHLCDQVHCQAYKGMARFNPEIDQAVEETESVVIVDSQINLIHATYHSNCGGQTVNSEEVWSKKVSYLRSVKDTFCIHSKHAQWQKSFGIKKFEKIFKEKYNLNAEEIETIKEIHPKERLSILEVNGKQLLTKEIRKDLKLNSNFFKISSDNRESIFVGRGFGHGVGLCQEGAMVMSKKGYSYFDILHHYYSNIHLVHRSYIAFFKEED
ncbi:MAG: SpoIID/LytB domain-containing protein [Bacteroidota bacterium]